MLEAAAGLLSGAAPVDVKLDAMTVLGATLAAAAAATAGPPAAVGAQIPKVRDLLLTLAESAEPAPLRAAALDTLLGPAAAFLHRTAAARTRLVDVLLRLPPAARALRRLVTTPIPAALVADALRDGGGALASALGRLMPGGGGGAGVALSGKEPVRPAAEVQARLYLLHAMQAEAVVRASVDGGARAQLLPHARAVLEMGASHLAPVRASPHADASDMLATSEFCALILLPLLRSVPALLPLSDGLHTNVAVDASGAARARIARRPSAELTSRGGGAVAAELLRLVASLHELLRPPADGGAAAADGVTWALGDEEAPPLVRNARLVVGPSEPREWSLRCPGAASFALAFAPDGDDAAAPAGVLRLTRTRAVAADGAAGAPPPADALGAGSLQLPIGSADLSLGCGERRDGYHGDPSRGHKFWVYPPSMALVTPRWDTHLPAVRFCSRARYVSTHANGVVEWCCGGHASRTPSAARPRWPLCLPLDGGEVKVAWEPAALPEGAQRGGDNICRSCVIGVTAVVPTKMPTDAAAAGRALRTAAGAAFAHGLAATLLAGAADALPSPGGDSLGIELEQSAADEEQRAPRAARRRRRRGGGRRHGRGGERRRRPAAVGAARLARAAPAAVAARRGGRRRRADAAVRRSAPPHHLARDRAGDGGGLVRRRRRRRRGRGRGRGGARARRGVAGAPRGRRRVGRHRRREPRLPTLRH